METRSRSSATGSTSCHSANSGGAIAYASDKFSAMQTHAVFADISSWRSPPAHRMTLQPAA